MHRKSFILGSILGLTGIVLGAFAAHGLEAKIPAEAIDTFETGVKYQIYSAFFLLFLGLSPLKSVTPKNICFYLTVIGVLLFSGSIYLLATNSLTAFDFRSIALATPLGGTLLIAAWAILLIQFIKLKKK